MKLPQKGALLQSKSFWGKGQILTRRQKIMEPRYTSAGNRHIDVILALLNHGFAEIDSRTEHEETSLNLTAQHDRAVMTSFLINRKAQIEIVANYEDTAVFRASERGREEVMLLLLERGANI